MKILITGAHFTPALAVIEELKKIDPTISIVYVGRSNTLEGDNVRSIESQLLPSVGIRFIPIIAGRIQRRISIYTILSLLKIPIGFIQSLFIIVNEKPDLIVSFGGYVAVPLVLTSWLWSIPILIHEQTLVSGLANKFSALFANKICVSFAENDLFKDKKAVLTGNPIRQELLTPGILPHELEQFIDKAKKEKLPLIFVTGGNQGSHVINMAIKDALLDLLKISFVIHQTGDSKYQDFNKLSEIKHERYVVTKWVGAEIGGILSQVDLIISRAGANTLIEAAFFKKPVLAIPIPYIFQDEQYKNAKYFEKLGLVTILPQSRLNGNSLIESVKSIFKSYDEVKQKAMGAENIVIQDAAKRVALEVMLLYSSEK